MSFSPRYPTALSMRWPASIGWFTTSAPSRRAPLNGSNRRAMADQDRFRFNLRDEEPEVAFHDEELKRRVTRLNRRLSFLTLLLPCLLAVALYVAYRDLVLRTSQTQSTELRSAEKVAAEIDQKMVSLDTRVADFEAALNARVEAAQKSVQALQEELRKGGSDVEKIGALKADKKDLA